MKPKCILVLKKFQVLCQKSPVESRYPELMYKIYCLYPPGYLVQRHLCFIEGVFLPLEARKGFLEEINLLRFHYTWLNGINSYEIDRSTMTKSHFSIRAKIGFYHFLFRIDKKRDMVLFSKEFDLL